MSRYSISTTREQGPTAPPATQSIHYAILNALNRDIGKPLPTRLKARAALDIDTGEPTRSHHVPTETTDGFMITETSVRPSVWLTTSGPLCWARPIDREMSALAFSQSWLEAHQQAFQLDFAHAPSRLTLD